MKNKTNVKQTFPWGLYTRSGHRLLFSDGQIRAAELSATADTFFSVPARARVSGKWISGYMTTEDGNGERVYSFRQHDKQETKHSLPAWDSLTDERKEEIILSCIKD